MGDLLNGQASIPLEEYTSVLGLVEADHNGFTYSVKTSGEQETEDAKRVYVFPRGVEQTTGNGVSVLTTSQQMVAFVKANFRAIRREWAGATMDQVKAATYYRLLVAQAGLVPVGVDPAAVNVKYIDSVIRDVPDRVDGDPDTDAGWLPTEQEREGLRTMMADALSCVAYIFRVRGHHWMAEIDPTYMSLWQKCQYGNTTPGLSWEMFAHGVAHAILPDTKDRFWRQGATEQRIAGALIKRIDAPCAGTAIVSALNAGLSDISVVLPTVVDKLPEPVDYLTRLTEELKNNRWAGSVNAKFYGAPILHIDETKLAGLASMILAVTSRLAENAPLVRSKALNRVASNAPVTGSTIAAMVSTAVRSDAAAAAFIRDVAD